MQQENALFKRQKKYIIYLGLIIFFLDVAFVTLNYYTSKKALDESILATAKAHQAEFNLTLSMTYRNMMQLGLFISQNNDLNQLFLQGKKAIAKEGGGAGKDKANKARQALLVKVKPAWDKLTENFNIRQLHYHLGPGSLSFLRVHAPNKYGDRMDNLRYIIVDTNHEKTARYGFETGRIYSGLRGVYPIWTNDPITGKNVYVGALETGTSFKQILPVFAKSFNTNIAVLLTKKHVESKMWPDFLKKHFRKNPSDQYYLEATSSKNINQIITQVNINNNFLSKKVSIIHQNNKYWSIYYFPLQDYQSIKENKKNNVGFILIWTDVTDLIDQFWFEIILNILFSIIALIIIEAALIWSFKRQKRLIIAERKAIFDGLSGVYNRGYFDQMFNQLKEIKDESTLPISLMMCDIDHFKQYNDTYGHQQGDHCLKEVAQTLKQNLRGKDDMLARYGGEEFVVVLTKTSKEDALLIAKRMLKAIRNLKIENKNAETDLNLTISIGISSIDSLDDIDQLINQADENLYHAKRNGRNQAF